MKRLALALILVLLPATLAFAQNPTTPVVELFGGGTWLDAQTSTTLAPFGLARVNAYGWNASATQNVTSWFGGTLDISGAYAQPPIVVQANAFGPGLPAAQLKFTNEITTSAYTFMYGPSFAYRRSERFTPFARVLLGGALADARTTSKGAAAIGMGENVSRNSFVMAAGVGIDIAITRRVALRATGDWIHTWFPDLNADNQNSFRTSAGFVFRFGSK